ncbi:MAG: NAD(P)-dependent oxidoreductase [Caldilineaceae bacterium]|nr:NAD(P)-dependent oxidoreductase [Caldilineaceae bacterium]
MKIVVTGSAGHLGEALVRTLQTTNHTVIAMDMLPSAFTTQVGSIIDRAYVKRCLAGADAVLHTATLHKPHVGTHSRQQFVDTNITGTLNLLEEAVANGVGAFIFTSTTSAFGDALVPPAGSPAAWITEEVAAVPKNIYGVTKTAAEDLCALFYRNQQLPCLILRTARFFAEADDDPIMRQRYVNSNAKVNEFLHRRIDLEDVVNAHLLALEKAPRLGFRRYILSATTPFTQTDLAALRTHAPTVVSQRVPGYTDVYTQRGWRMFPSIDRVYVNTRARQELGWQPRYDFAYVVERLRGGEDFRSSLACTIGTKGYHATTFAESPYPLGE